MIRIIESYKENQSCLLSYNHRMIVTGSPLSGAAQPVKKGRIMRSFLLY